MSALNKLRKSWLCQRFITKVFLWLFILALTKNVTAQEEPPCDFTAITAKYWQYKERFNKHFICRDRDELAGCVHDGIGFSQEPSDDTDSQICDFDKSGYSLPITSINLTKSGLWGMGPRTIPPPDEPENPFGDHDCMGGLSWDSYPYDPGHKFNFAEMGSETLTQTGWYLTTLATEYELLGKSGQIEEQKKTLEDIFLALQAIRRLDMQAQCLLKEMYDDRQQPPAPGDPIGSTIACTGDYISAASVNFDAGVKRDCNYQPDFSGYYGFMLREDATQDLKDCIHDPTSENWNVDGIGSAYGVSTNSNSFPLCDPVDRFCFHALNQNFFSQDQIINLLYGLSFIKKCIPPEATVTTCEGETFNILDMAKTFATNIVLKIDDNGNSITLPGTSKHGGCTFLPGSLFHEDVPVKISASAGGNCNSTIHGMILAYEYITGNKRNSTMGQKIAFNALGNFDLHPFNNQTNYQFHDKLIAMSVDMSKLSTSKRNKFASRMDRDGKEILLLGNDLLFPDGFSVSQSAGVGQSWILNELCAAPCGGPCRKQGDYDDNVEFPDYDCPNTPGWLGTRWDGNGDENKQENLPINKSSNRQFNGLDFMALYNMFALKYLEDEPYYNPFNPESSSFLHDTYGSSKIEGKEFLCIGEPDLYKVIPTFISEDSGYFSSTQWTVSGELEIVEIFPDIWDGHDADMAEIEGVATTQNAIIEVNVEETRNIPQNYKGTNFGWVKDECQLNHRKIVEVGDFPTFTISTNFDFCGQPFNIKAEGQDIPNATFAWEIKNFITNQTMMFFGKNITAQATANLANLSYGEIRLRVIIPASNGNCNGERIFKQNVQFKPCGNMPIVSNNSGVNIFPNPVLDEFTMVIDKNGYQIPTEGSMVKVINAMTGQISFSERIYSKIHTIYTSSLSNGNYNLQVLTGNLSPLNTSFIIQKN